MGKLLHRKILISFKTDATNSVNTVLHIIDIISITNSFFLQLMCGPKLLCSLPETR